MEADDQAIQTILMGLLEDIYAAVDSCDIAKEIWLRVQQMMKGSDIGLQEKEVKLSNEWENFKSTEGELIESYYHRNQVGHNAVQNLGIQNVGNHNGLIVVLGTTKRNANQNRNGNVVAARAEGNSNANNGDIDEIEDVNANYNLMANLQQASPSGTQADKAPVYDSDGSTEFMGTVRFGNEHIAAILGYGNLQLGNILFARVAFKRNTCFVRNLEGVDLLKENRTTNIYTINLHEMTFASPICLMARATATKSWLWHQRLSHLNFGTINELAKNDLVIGLPKFKYYKEHLFPSCEQGKSKKLPHKSKPIPNLKQRFDKTPYELINDRKSDISFLYLFGALCYPKNDCEDIRKLGAKGDIGFFVGYSATSYAYRVYNRRTWKIMEMMNVTFDELSTMAFEQRTMYDDYIGGQSLDAPRTAHAAPTTQNLHTLNASTTTADSAPTLTNSSIQATNIPNTL
ncbi:retrovirus-related pol polyprotein from transposon TNT 1-94 [Tanacetum coccineum]